METITESQIRNLVQAGVPPCVSIYLPTHRQGRDVRQDPVRLKNLLKDAEQQLVSYGVRPTEALDLLEPARRYIDDTEFWLRSEGGLAIFLGKDFFRLYRLPIEVEDLAHVNDKFEIKPLLPLMQNKLFYILALSQNAARLLECTPHGCRKLDLPEDTSTALKDAMGGEDEHQTRLQRHSGASNNPFSGAGAYHGQVVDLERQEQEDKMFYLRQLDDGVMRTIKDGDSWLIVAGVDSFAPFYRKATSHKRLFEEFIEGNPEHVPNETLHEKALQMLEPIWKKELNSLQDQFGSATSKSMASTSLEEIVPSSMQGRVDTLFVAPRQTRWGRFHEDEQRVEIHAERGDGDIDLIDRAATQTLMNGGRIVVCSPEEIPGNKEIAAIYRY